MHPAMKLTLADCSIRVYDMFSMDSECLLGFA